MARHRALRGIQQAAEQACARRGCTLEFTEVNADPPAAGDSRTIAIAEEVCRTLNVASQRMISRAYHDSLFMARVCPTTMLFIPCRNGWSHRPDEYAEPKHIAIGVEVLAHTLARLAA
jgi:N-carbamoyl-L-amino-acid hydrolase